MNNNNNNNKVIQQRHLPQNKSINSNLEIKSG